MRMARNIQIGALAVLALVSSRTAAAQSRSAALRVTAEVVSVGALSWAPTAGTDQAAAPSPSSAVVTGGASGQAFSVVPPRHAAVVVSMRLEGGPRGRNGDLAIQLCRPTDVRRGCRRVPLADAPHGRHAAAVTDEAVVLRLTGLPSVAQEPARVTVTLAYPDS